VVWRRDLSSGTRTSRTLTGRSATSPGELSVPVVRATSVRAGHDLGEARDGDLEGAFNVGESRLGKWHGYTGR